MRCSSSSSVSCSAGRRASVNVADPRPRRHARTGRRCGAGSPGCGCVRTRAGARSPTGSPRHSQGPREQDWMTGLARLLGGTVAGPGTADAAVEVTIAGAPVRLELGVTPGASARPSSPFASRSASRPARAPASRSPPISSDRSRHRRPVALPRLAITARLDPPGAASCCRRSSARRTAARRRRARSGIRDRRRPPARARRDSRGRRHRINAL